MKTRKSAILIVVLTPVLMLGMGFLSVYLYELYPDSVLVQLVVLIGVIIGIVFALPVTFMLMSAIPPKTEQASPEDVINNYYHS
jgi:hypothetical protein